MTTPIAGTVITTSFLGSLRRTRVLLDDGTLLSVQHDVSDRQALASRACRERRTHLLDWPGGHPIPLEARNG